MTRFARRTTTLLACSLIVALVAACGSGSNPAPTQGTESGSAAATPAAAAPSDSVLPEGTYRTPELTREQLITGAEKAGLSKTQVEQALARDGIEQTAAFALKLEGGQFTQFFSYDGGAEGIGSRGTYEVVDSDTVVTTEECCGETTLEYSLDSDSIRFRWIKANGYANRQMCQRDPECAMAFVVTESAPFSRT